MGYLRVSKRVSEGDLMRYPRGYPIRCPVHNINLPTKKYLAGVASPASLLAQRARGCNEIYHLKYFLFSTLY